MNTATDQHTEGLHEDDKADTRGDPHEQRDIQKNLKISILLNALIFVIELVGGLLTNNLSYRHATGIQCAKMLGSNASFSGNDFRFGIEGRFAVSGLELQSEYIEAHLGARKASGFYALADYLITPVHQVTLSIEQLRDLNPSTRDDPWYIVAYSHLFKGEQIKLSLENRFQWTNSTTNAQTIVQFQYFFHQS